MFWFHLNQRERMGKEEEEVEEDVVAVVEEDMEEVEAKEEE